MTRIAYVNGHFLPHSEAAVSIDDRSFTFSDGVYEVTAVHRRRLVDAALHLARLRRSLKEMAIEGVPTDASLMHLMQELIRRNLYRDGALYLQISRAVAPRAHPFPAHAKPALMMSILPAKLADQAVFEKGVKVLTAPDQRWARRDIKTVSLLPNVLARQKSFSQGCKETWLVNAKGEITEGSYSNAMLVDHAGVLVTHPATQAILGGVTRAVVLEIARERGIHIQEKPFTPGDISYAREGLLTGTTTLVLPVLQVDGVTIGDGKPGPVARMLFEGLWERIRGQTCRQSGPAL